MDICRYEEYLFTLKKQTQKTILPGFSYGKYMVLVCICASVLLVNCTPLTFMGTGSYLMSSKLVLDWKRKLRRIVRNEALES